MMEGVLEAVRLRGGAGRLPRRTTQSRAGHKKKLKSVLKKLLGKELACWDGRLGPKHHRGSPG